MSAVNDCVITRFNETREPVDRIAVNYIYGPKDRVYFDLINKEKNITLPVVSCSLGGIRRSTERVKNKQNTNYFVGGSYVTPVPVDVTVNMNIWTRYQSDMDQIIQNFAVYFDPYIYISWHTPIEFGLSGQEIRSQAVWSGDVSLDYPAERTQTDIVKYQASTSFTIHGWLFKDNSTSGAPIYVINSDYFAVSTINENITSATPVDSFSLTGVPHISNTFVNSIPWTTNISVISGDTPTVTLVGNFFDRIESVLLSSDSLTAGIVPVSGYPLSADIPATSGLPISSYSVYTGNSMSITLPVIEAGTYDVILLGDGGWTSLTRDKGVTIEIQ